MSRKTVELEISPLASYSTLMGCLSTRSREALRAEEENGFRVAGVKNGQIEVILEKADEQPTNDKPIKRRIGTLNANIGGGDLFGPPRPTGS